MNTVEPPNIRAPRPLLILSFAGKNGAYVNAARLSPRTPQGNLKL